MKISSLLVTVAGLCLAASAHALTFYVLTTSDDPNLVQPIGDGDLISSLRYAVNHLHAAGVGDTINLLGVTGTITLAGGPDNPLSITQNVTINGPGADKLAIDGAGGQPVFFIANGTTANISGVTIQNGRAFLASPSQGSGGGILQAGGTLHLTNVTLRNNLSQSTGGAIAASGVLTLANCTVSNNTSPTGGGVYLNAGTLTLTSSTFQSNQAFGRGGAVFINGGSGTATDCAFSGNSASNLGGGLDLEGGSLGLTACTITNNNVSGGYGGGLHVAYQTTATLSNCTLSGNVGSNGGGGIFVEGGTLNATGCAITGNTQTTNFGRLTEAGGGILNSYHFFYDGQNHYVGGTSTLTNCTVAGNTTAPLNAGGGICNDFFGVLQLNQCTIANNGAQHGGGIFSYGNSGATVSMSHSIVANNGGGGSDVDDDGAAGGFASGGANLIRTPQNSLSGFHPSDLLGVDPLLGPLQDNGGPTLTMLPAVASPAVAYVPPPFPATDQRGAPRPGSPSGKATIGAVEVVSGVATITFGNLTQSYTGSPLTPTVTTVPAGLAVILTGVPQTNAGSYPVTARVNDSVYQGSAGAVFVINKASATVTLGNLTQTYTGSPLAPTVTTVPAGLNVIVTGGPQTNAGSYPFTATISEANYQGSGTGTFVINKATPTVTIANLQQTYTGSPLSPTVTTLPAGLKVIVTGFPQTNAGFYPVTAAVNDPNYLPGSVTDSFLIDKALAVFVWDHLIQTYTGTPLSPGVTTIPAGLTVVITGTPLPQVNAGSYPITGTINDLNYRGVSQRSLLIQPAPATVTLSNLTQTFTGSPLSPTVTTVPAGVSFKFFNGAPQTNAGVYPVTAGVTNPNYITASGTGGGTFRINKASVPVTLKATPLYFANGTWSSTNPKPASCASVSGICQAYSDQMKFTVTLPAFAGTDSENVLTPVPCATASGTVIAPCVNVAVGGQTYGPVALTSAGSTLTGTITPALVNGPGAYSFGAVTPVAGSNPNLSLTTSNASDHFTVVAEDALLTYTGLTDFTTAPNVTAQNIAVSYTVQDPSAVNSSNPNYDPSSGNIQLARFTFTLTGTSPSGPVTRSCSTGSGSLVSTGAGTVTAQCVINSVPTNGSYTLTATAQSFPLPDGSVAPYIPAGGDVSVAIKNGNDGVGSIKGDGAQTAEYLASSQPAQGKYPAFGLLTPAPGTKVKFDFKGDYQKKGIDAKATIEIQAMAQTTDPEGNAKPKKELHTYRIEADQIESLTIEPPLELWVSTAKITDATDHNKVVSTNAQLQMVMHAVAEGKEGKGDKPSLSIQVSDDTNGLWFSNNWTGVNTAVSETTPQIQEGMITFKEK